MVIEREFQVLLQPLELCFLLSLDKLVDHI